MSPINSFLAARLISADSAAPTSFSIPSSASAVSAPSASASAAANAGPPPPPLWLGPLGIVALVGFVISFSYMLVVQYRRQCAAAAEAAKNASMPPPRPRKSSKRTISTESHRSSLSTETPIAAPPPAYTAGSTLSAEDALLRITRANTLRNSIPCDSIVGAQVFAAPPSAIAPPNFTAETPLPPILRPVGARWAKRPRRKTRRQKHKSLGQANRKLSAMRPGRGQSEKLRRGTYTFVGLRHTDARAHIQGGHFLTNLQGDECSGLYSVSE
ncbi:hypothetical protein B0H19DRAFT_1065729 [Mycena capillaripes]|nr:hypothetical protein B0H19DRAFT_1065729 [Mycena capillaripes]